MEHHEIEEQLTAYLLGDLSPEQAEAMREHLDECDDCRALAKELEPTLDLLRGALAVDPVVPVRLDDERKEEIFAPRHVPATVIWLTAHRSVLTRVAGVAAIVIVLAALMLPVRNTALSTARKMPEDRLDAPPPPSSAAPEPVTRKFSEEEEAVSNAAPMLGDTPMAGRLFKSQEGAAQTDGSEPESSGNVLSQNAIGYVESVRKHLWVEASGPQPSAKLVGGAGMAEADWGNAAPAETPARRPQRFEINGEAEYDALAVTDADSVRGLGLETATAAQGVSDRGRVALSRRNSVSGKDLEDGSDRAPGQSHDPFYADVPATPASIRVRPVDGAVPTAPEMPERVALNGSRAADSDDDGIRDSWGRALGDGRKMEGLSRADSGVDEGALLASLADSEQETTADLEGWEAPRPSGGVEVREGIQEVARPVIAPTQVASASGRTPLYSVPEDSDESSAYAQVGDEAKDLRQQTLSFGMEAEEMKSGSEVAGKNAEERFRFARPQSGEYAFQDVVDGLVQIEDRPFAQAGSNREREVAQVSQEAEFMGYGGYAQLGDSAGEDRDESMDVAALAVSPQLLDLMLDADYAEKEVDREEFVEMGGARTFRRTGIKQYFQEQGVPFPPGTQVKYDAETRELVVKNTRENLELLEKFIEPHLDESRKSGRIDAGMMKSDTPDEPEGNWAWLDDVVIPSLGFRNSDIQVVLSDLKRQIEAADPQGREIPIQFDGVAIESADAPAVLDQESHVPKITLTLRKITAADALKIVTEYADLDLEVKNGEVLVASNQAAAEPEPETELVARAYGVNPFVSAVEQPFSTFAIDVDTAAYTLMRKHVQNGVLPPAEAVRTEEFVNFFDYDYRAPERQTFAVYTTLAPTPFGDGRLLKIGVKGKRLGREEQRPAVLTFVIDTSGSMDTPDRLGLVRRSLDLLIDELGEADQVAIVQVDSQARLILPPTALADRDAIAAAIDGLQCSGSTHLEDGIKLGYEVAAQAFTGGSVNRVLLLSDGAANLGSADAEQILSMVESHRSQGIFCSVFGFGIGAYNDEILEQLANKGDGAYRFIDSQEEAKRVFVDELAATLHVIASDVKIQVEFYPEQVKTYRQLGYENRQLTKEQFRDDTVDAGEVGSGESVTALYELVAGANTDQPLGVVRVRYRDAATGEVEEIAHPIRMSDAVASFEEAGPRFRLAAAVAEFAEILRGSPYADGADYAAVTEVLRPVALDLRLDQRVQELLQLVQRAPGLPRASGN